MTIRRRGVFPGVAQAKSFRRAAERIRLSQVPSTSTLSANEHDALRGLRARSAELRPVAHPFLVILEVICKRVNDLDDGST
jgi:hypothetical protein